MRQIIVDISPDGDVKVYAKGIKGSGCKSATAGIEGALGVVTADVPTKEYHDRATAVSSAQLKT